MRGDSGKVFKAIRAVRKISAGGRSGPRDALDFNPDTGGVGDDLELLDPYTDSTDPSIGQGERGDTLGQGLHEAQMALGDDGPDAVHHLFVINHIFQKIADGGCVLGHGEVDVDADRLGAVFLMAVDPYMGIQQQISHEDVPDGIGGRGDAERLGDGIAGHASLLAWRRSRFKIGRTEGGMKSSGATEPMTPLWDAARSYQRVVLRDVVTEVRLGLHPWERHKERPQRIIVNVELFAHLDGPFGGRDAIIDYDAIRDALKSWPARDHVDLIETLLEELVALCFANSQVAACRVSIIKPDIFNEAGGAGVEVYRVRP